MVIPLWNGERFVLQALESVMRQTRIPDEIIVVDDQSTDGGPALVARRFPNVRLVTVDKGGPGAARNHGVRHASSEWIAFLDSDDEWYPWHLEDLELALSTHSDCRFASTKSVFSDSKPIIRLDRKGFSARKLSYFELMSDDVRAVNSSSTIVHRTTFMAVGGCSSEYTGEDIVGWLRMGLVSQLTQCPNVSVFVRRNPDSIMGRARAAVIEGQVHSGAGHYRPSVADATSSGVWTTLSDALGRDDLPAHVSRRSILRCRDSFVRGHIRANVILGVESRSWTREFGEARRPVNIFFSVLAWCPTRLTSGLARAVIKVKNARRSRRVSVETPH